MDENPNRIYDDAELRQMIEKQFNNLVIVFQDSSGSIESLEKGHITRGNDFSLPDGDKWYRLDHHTDPERMYLLASKNPIKDFTKKIEELKNNGIKTIGKVFPEDRSYHPIFQFWA